MKKISLLAILILPIFCASELFLEITKGSEDPFKVAMIPFAGSSIISKKLDAVIRNDLNRTGEFSMLDKRLLLPLKMEDEDINYQDWKLLGMDYVIAGNIINDKNSIDVDYEIYDIQNFQIALPKERSVYSNKEKKWKQFEYPKELGRLKNIFDWRSYPEEKKS